jgi:hypothetical protein
MKNIHVLPTENESRIRYNSFNKVYELCEFPKYHTDIKSTQNIYITSDEEIKEGDWCLNEDVFDKHLLFKADSLFFDTGLEAKKIILTTDQDLIKDGVQAIDDEFLEWFVKNPSCEEVEVLKNECNYDEYRRYFDYKIIIPKEEAKQEILEEDAKRYATDMSGIYYEDLYNAVIFGAKWQAERMYSDIDEAIWLLKQTTEYEVLESFKGKVKELEQYKNK